MLQSSGQISREAYQEPGYFYHGIDLHPVVDEELVERHYQSNSKKNKKKKSKHKSDKTEKGEKEEKRHAAKPRTVYPKGDDDEDEQVFPPLKSYSEQPHYIKYDLPVEKVKEDKYHHRDFEKDHHHAYKQQPLESDYHHHYQLYEEKRAPLPRRETTTYYEEPHHLPRYDDL